MLDFYLEDSKFTLNFIVLFCLSLARIIPSEFVIRNILFQNVKLTFRDKNRFAISWFL